MRVIEILSMVAGTAIVLATLGSALRSMVVPRGEQVALTRLLFGFSRWVWGWRADKARTWEKRDRILARMAPTTLMLLPLVWSALVILGFSLIYWGLDPDRPWSEELQLSGSSLTTLGFRTADDFPTVMLSVLQGLVGLGIIALIISYLPTMYSSFSRRETAVSKLFLRVADSNGEPSHAAMFARWWQVDAFERLPSLWEEWEDWFVAVEESHTSFPALVFFRSPTPYRHWVTASGLALDQAALYLSVIDLRREPRAPLMLRTGYLSLRAVADYFGIEYEAEPQPDDEISISREEFQTVYDEIAEAGVPVRSDADQAWRDFRGWRVNYDTVLLDLCSLTLPPWAPWSSDRAKTTRPDRLLRFRMGR